MNINDLIATYFNVNWHLLDISVSAIFSSDEIKKKVEERFNELGDMCERGEIEAEEAYELFKKFEDEMVIESQKIMEAEETPQFDETAVPDEKNDSDDPPGEGPILRWQTRVVFAPGGDAWHPKNRKVKNVCYCENFGFGCQENIRKEKKDKEKARKKRINLLRI